MSRLQAQIKEQEVKVKAAAPDKKQLDDLQKKINAFRKGQRLLLFFLRTAATKLIVLPLLGVCAGGGVTCVEIFREFKYAG